MTTKVTKGDDGKYRWTYDLNMYKTPVILFTVLKVISIAVVAVWIFAVLISAGDNGFWWEGFLKTLKVFALIELGGCVLGAIAYLIIAVCYGGKYSVEFEMDENGVRHTQIASQAKKARTLGSLTAFAGAAAKNPTAVGAGMMSGSKTSSYSEFSKVRKVRVYPVMNVIKLNAPLNKNQVYASKEDFDFVRDYIIERVNKKN